ncbi:MAG: hypothetical protein LVQ96_04360 [Thermoplasmatales archaeon]|nr:hypothetical protein [Thermoplasmatales archaeon]MCW6170387.1 hypothetical protein [Thermoplasmatales archaeon]
MGLTYFDVLSLYFKDSEFSTKDIALLLRTERSAKLLSELKFRGLIERTGRGKYRLFTPSERIDTRSYEWKRVEKIVNSSPLPYVWAWSTAVEKWTNGAYLVGPNPYFRTYYIEVLISDIDKWKRYLRSHSVPIVGKRRIGAIVELISKEHLESVIHNGERVLPKERTLEIIRNHRGIFAEADELIED